MRSREVGIRRAENVNSSPEHDLLAMDIGSGVAEPPLTLKDVNDAVEKLQGELDAFYLMWAGARVPAALAPPLSRHRRGHMGWC